MTCPGIGLQDKILFLSEHFLKTFLDELPEYNVTDEKVDTSFFKYLFSFFLSFSTSCSTWNLSSLAGDRTHAPCIGSADNYWTAREVPRMFLISLYTFCFCLFSLQKLLEASLSFEFHIHTSRFGSICTDCVEIK